MLSAKIAKLLSVGQPALTDRDVDVKAMITLGIDPIDQAMHGGLQRAGVHEIYGHSTHGAASGFTAALALRAAGKSTIFWARQDFLDAECGKLNASGLHELGIDPANVILVMGRDAESVYRAGEQALRCSALGAVVIETWRDPKIINFTTSRRLTLAAAKSGVPVFMLRVESQPSQTSAHTRWMVHPSLSSALEANAPGFPCFELSLLRHRGGTAGKVWVVEWDRDRRCFKERSRQAAAPTSRPLVSVSSHRSHPKHALIPFSRTG